MYSVLYYVHNTYIYYIVSFLSQTLDLLYKMTNPTNVTVITDRLLAYLRSSSNKFIKADLVSKLTQLAERYPCCV